MAPGWGCASGKICPCAPIPKQGRALFLQLLDAQGWDWACRAKLLWMMGIGAGMHVWGSGC